MEGLRRCRTGKLPADEPWDPGQVPTRTRPAFALILRRVVFAAAVVVQLVALYLPRVPSTSGMEVPGADKVVHALVFALVMLTGILAGINAKWLAVILVAHAVLSEVVQYTLLPHRTGDPLDAVADLAGILLGWYLAGMFTRHRSGGLALGERR